LTHTGGPLNSHPTQHIQPNSHPQSPLQKYASLLLSQQDADLHRSMLKNNRNYYDVAQVAER